MNHKITADWTKLAEDGGSTAINYLNTAIESIDKQFGKGYAKAHPELVGAFMQTSATEAAGMYHAKAMQEIEKKIEQISSNLFLISEEIRKI